MGAERSYVADNRAELGRLRGLVARLSDGELEHPMPAGWTVAGVLGHLAFWDQRVLVLLEGWGPEGRGAAPPPLDEAAVHWINDAAKALCLAMPARVAAMLAVATAEAVDAKVAGLPDALLGTNEAAGRPINLRRAEHRREHLDEIERALAAPPGQAE